MFYFPMFHSFFLSLQVLPQRPSRSLMELLRPTCPSLKMSARFHPLELLLMVSEDSAISYLNRNRLICFTIVWQDFIFSFSDYFRELEQRENMGTSNNLLTLLQSDETTLNVSLRRVSISLCAPDLWVILSFIYFIFAFQPSTPEAPSTQEAPFKPLDSVQIVNLPSSPAGVISSISLQTSADARSRKQNAKTLKQRSRKYQLRPRKWFVMCWYR